MASDFEHDSAPLGELTFADLRSANEARQTALPCAQAPYPLPISLGIK